VLLAFVFFEDVERVPVVELHADGSENGTHGPGSTPLLADNLAHILRSDPESEDGIFIPIHRFHVDSGRLIDQGLSDLANQRDD
jgi:hypothetical protein